MKCALLIIISSLAAIHFPCFWYFYHELLMLEFLGRFKMHVISVPSIDFSVYIKIEIGKIKSISNPFIDITLASQFLTCILKSICTLKKMIHSLMYRLKFCFIFCILKRTFQEKLHLKPAD